NLVLQESTYTKTDGTQGKMVDVNFSYDSIHTQYLEELPPENTANLQGFGYLRDLNQAASLSKDLHHQLNEYSQLTTKDEQLNHLDSLLKSWAQTSPYYSNDPIDIQSKTFYRNEEFFQNNKDVPRITASQANVMQNGLKNLNEQLDSEQLKSFNQEETQDKLHILQSFYGINHHTIYLNKPDELDDIIDNIDNDYAALKEDTYQHLLFQTRLKPYLQEIEIDENEEIHFEKVADKFNEVFNTLPEKALIDLSEFLQHSNLGQLNPQFNQQFATFYEQTENAETLVDQETAAQIIHANHEVSLTDETAEIILLGNVIDKENFAKIESITAENEDDWAMHDTETIPDWRDIEGDDEDDNDWFV
ncbi:MAG: hypothetical protein IKN18_02560, partial [Neisseriaceae bacterium]|nr:hypothetical protein [Neisseriaceae bacterium]